MRMIRYVAAGLAMAGLAMAASGLFRGATMDPAPRAPQARLLPASVDRIPKASVAAAEATTSTTGFGFAAPVLLTWPQSCGTGDCNFREVAVGDVTGDGLDDLVAANAGQLWIVPQRSDHTLATSAIVFQYGSPLYSDIDEVRLGDMNEDGILDVVTRRVTDAGDRSGLAMALSDGKGGFTFRTFDARTPDNWSRPTLVDVDLDGHLDVVGEYSQSLFAACCAYWKTFYGDGRGGVSREARTDLPSYDTIEFGMADFDGDALPDLAVVFGLYAQGVGDLQVARHRAAGGFEDPRSIVQSGSPIHYTAHTYGDFNHDGRIDMALLGEIGLQTATNTYEYTQLLGYSPYPPVLLATDLDRDGRTDLIAPQMIFNGVYSDPEMQVYLQQGGAMQMQPRGPWWTQNTVGDDPNQLAVGDLDGDGCTDLAMANAQDGIQVFHGEHCQHVAPAASDFDGDHQSDLFWHNARSTANVIWTSASFASLQHLQGLGSIDWTIAGSGDVTGDGRADLLLRHRTSGANVLWPSANPRRAKALADVRDAAWQVAAVADVDGDRKADVIWRNGITGANTIWKDGNSAARITLPGVRPEWSLAGAADLDGDGKADLLWRNRATGQNVLWKAGNATTTMSLTPAIPAWQIAGLGDFDGDGKADIVWRNLDTGANALWRSGLSAAAVPMTSVTNLDWCIVAVGDYDGDGRADLAWRNARTGANVIWLRGQSNRVRPVFGVASLDWQVAR